MYKQNETILLGDELEALFENVSLNQAHVLDIGCGDGSISRRILEESNVSFVTGIECDRAQLTNSIKYNLDRLLIEDGVAEALKYPKQHFDVISMFKSLHHVPVEQMQVALNEIARVLKRDGVLFVLEPVYGGEFNDLVKMFHDEGYVRRKALEVIQWAQDNNLFKLQAQNTYLVPIHFKSFEEFEEKIMRATSNNIPAIDEQLYNNIKIIFTSHQGPDGSVQFNRPVSTFVLQKVS